MRNDDKPRLPTDLLIEIRPKPPSPNSYLAEVTLSNGSVFQHSFTLDILALKQASSTTAQGEQLFAALFQGGVREALGMAQAAADADNGDVRIRLRLATAAHELHELPWEALRRSASEQPLAAARQTTFSRYLSSQVAAPSPLRATPLHLLAVIANPSDLENKFGLAAIDVGEQISTLYAALRTEIVAKRLRVTVLTGEPIELPDVAHDFFQIETRPITLAAIAEHLNGCHLLHFVGHGAERNQQAALYLERLDADGQHVTDIVFSHELAATLANADPRPYLVFLCACHSAAVAGGVEAAGLAGAAPDLARVGIPAVVAMREQLTMTAAGTLVQHFYRTLLRDGLVDQALNVARGELLRRQDEQGYHDMWARPIAYLRLQHGQLFTPDPLQAALVSMLRHPRFRFFDPQRGAHLPLPVEVVHLEEPLKPSIFDQPEQQATATTRTETAFAKVLARGSEEAEPLIIGLVGGFGSNKTMQLRWLMWQTLVEGLDGDGSASCLPIYVDLADFRPNQSPLQNSLERYILKTLRDNFWPDLAARTLTDLPDGLRLRLLFANLDTMPDADSKTTVEQLIDRLQHYSTPENYRFIDYVIAARHDGVAWRTLEQHADLHLFVVQPLNHSHMRRVLERLDRMEAIRELAPAVRRQRGQRLLEHIFQRDLFDLLSIPWFMFRMIQAARQNKFPKSRAAALMQMIDTPLSSLDARIGLRGDAAETLYALAWEMQQNSREELSIRECFAIFARVRGSRGYSLEALFSALIQVDLLVMVNNQTLRLGYLPFQAYCFAQAVMRHPERQQVLRDIILTLSVPHKLVWWQGALITICGLMALEGEWMALHSLLRSLVFGQNLSQGPQAFLVGRCLLECGIDAGFDRRISAESTQPPDTQDLAKIAIAPQLIKLRNYTVEALNWHTLSRHEPSATRRASAIELLSLLAPADRLIEKAAAVYKAIRENDAHKQDYEFSVVRMAAAISLKRQPKNITTRRLNEFFSKDVKTIYDLWTADLDEATENTLKRLVLKSRDLGARAFAALALGDMAATARCVGDKAQANEILQFLGDALRQPETAQPVRWALADALAMCDSMQVSELVIVPYVEQDRSAVGWGESAEWLTRDKAMAYLIGLLRDQSAIAHHYLITHCLQQGSDHKLWFTALTALGAVATNRSKRFLQDVASGTIDMTPIVPAGETVRRAGESLRGRFSEHPEQARALQRKAIELLSVYHDWAMLDTLFDSSLLVEDDKLVDVLFDIAPAAYWKAATTNRS